MRSPRECAAPTGNRAAQLSLTPTLSRRTGEGVGKERASDQKLRVDLFLETVLTGTKSRICTFLTPGAGVTPAEGSVKPIAGFTFNKVIYPSLCCCRPC
jgi:hypothetical protein